jgi:hypothetical protein
MRIAKILLHATVGLITAINLLSPGMLFWGVQSANAATLGAPSTIGYQGRLKNASSGAVVSNGTYYFRFYLYDAATGGTQVTSDTATLTVTNGYFSTNIDLSTDVVDFVNNLWMEIGVSSDGVTYDTMTTRVKLNSSAYSFVTRAIENSASAPATDLFNGRMYFNTTTGKLNVYNGTAWVGVSNTLDDAYNNFGAVASKITVDASEGQTGGLEFELSATNNPNLIVDTQGTGDFVIQDAGSTWAQFTDGQAFDVNGTGAISLDADAASNFNTSVGDLTVEAEVGSLILKGDEAVADAIYLDANDAAGTGITMVTGATAGYSLSGGPFSVGVSGLISLDAGAASDFRTSVGDLTIDSEAGSLNLASGENVADSIVILSDAGGIDITAAAASAGEDIDITTTGSSINLISTEADSAAIRLDADASTGSGIQIDAYDATNNISGVVQVDGGTVQINTNSSTGLDLNVLGSGNANIDTTDGDISLTAGGSSGDISITSSQGDISINTNTNTKTINLGTTNYNRTVNVSTGTGNDTLNLARSATGSKTINIGNTSGTTTIDIEAGTGGIDMDLTATGAFAIDGDLVVIGNAGVDGDVADGDNDLLVAGVLEVDGEFELDGSLDADVTTFDVDASDLVSLTSTKNNAQAIYLEATAGGIDIAATGASAGEDIDITATGSSVNVSATEAAADSITVFANAEGGAVAVRAGDNADASTANGNDVYVGAEDDILIDANDDMILTISDDFSLTALDLILTGTETTDINATNEGITIDATDTDGDGGGTITLTGNDGVAAVATTGNVALTAAAGNVAFTATAEDVTANSGDDILLTATDEFDATSTGLMDLNAGANLDIDVTGTYDMLATTTFSIDGTGASNVSATSGNLTVSTITTGDLLLSSAAEADITAVGLVDINAGANLDIDVTGSTTIDSTTNISLDSATASNFTVTGASQDLTLSSVGGSVNVSATETALDAINIDSSGGLDIDTADDVSITVAGAAGEDVLIENNGGSIGLVASEAIADAIILNASGGGIYMTAAVQDFDIIASTTDVDLTGATNVDVLATAGDFTVGTGDDILLNPTDDLVLTVAAGAVVDLADDAVAKTINIGGVTTNGTDTINIATNNTSADVISIGNNHASSTLALTGGDEWSMATTGLLTFSPSAALAIAMDATDADIATALSVGANDIVGTTGLINYTNFDVNAAGNITVAAAEGLDTNAAGALELGVTNATSLSIGSAAMTAVSITTDGTGDAEVVLPAQSISATEILNDTIDFAQMADAMVLDTATSITGEAGEVFSIQRTLTDATTENGMLLNVTASDTTSGTTAQFGLAIANADSTEGLDALVFLKNNDNDDVVTDAIRVSNPGAADMIVDALDASGANITNALNIGANIITGTDGIINFTDFGLIAEGAITVAPDADVVSLTVAPSVAQTTAIDLSAPPIATAISVGANDIVGTTGLINYTNFDVNAAGNITVAAAEGLDTNAAGALELGIANATSILVGINLLTDSAGDNNLGSATAEWDGLYVGDDGVGVAFGADQDAGIFFSTGTGDLTVDLSDTVSFVVDGDGTPTADLMTIGVGDTSETGGVDALQLSFTASNASGNVIDITPSVSNTAAYAETFSIFDVDAFTATMDNSGGSLTVNGLNIGNLTQVTLAGSMTTTAINIGSGWGNALVLDVDNSDASNGIYADFDGSNNQPFTGTILNLDFDQNYNQSSTDDTGRMAVISRDIDMNNGGQTLTVSGDMLTIESLNTQTAGTLTETGSLLSLNQTYSGASGQMIEATSTATAANMVNLSANSNYTGSLISLNSTEESTGSFFFISATSDTDGTPDVEFKVDQAGTVYGDGGAYSTPADFAEFFYDASGTLSAGEVVSVDITNANAVTRSVTARDSHVMGVVSTKAAFVGNWSEEKEASNNWAIVGLAGQVPVKVTSENGAIAIGDYLTSSSTAGYAMKADAGDPTIGIALESFSGSEGMIQTLISRNNGSLQGGSAALTSMDSDTLTVAGDASFGGSVTVAEHLYGSKDMAGRARMLAGHDYVHVAFEQAYEDTPVITFSSRSDAEAMAGYQYWVGDESATGFTIYASGWNDQVREFSWIAMGVIDGTVTISDGTTSGFDGDVTVAEMPVVESAPAPVEEPVVEEIPPVEEVVDEEPVVEEPVVEEPVAPEVPAETVVE